MVSADSPFPFPTDGWSTKVEDVPKVSVGALLQHLEKRYKEGSACPISEGGVTHKPLDRGYSFFFWSYVQSVVLLLVHLVLGSLYRLLSPQIVGVPRGNIIATSRK